MQTPVPMVLAVRRIQKFTIPTLSKCHRVVKATRTAYAGGAPVDHIAQYDVVQDRALALVPSTHAHPVVDFAAPTQADTPRATDALAVYSRSPGVMDS